MATKPATCSAAASASITAAGGEAEQPGEEAGLEQLGEEGAAARHRHHQQAGEARLGGRRAGVLGDPVALGGAGREAAQGPGQVAAARRWLSSAAAKASTRSERIGAPPAGDRRAVAAPRSSSAPSRASSAADGPSR